MSDREMSPRERVNSMEGRDRDRDGERRRRGSSRSPVRRPKSRSRSRSRDRRRARSRSRSGSYSRGGRDRRSRDRSPGGGGRRSRSPMSARKRHVGDRDRPDPSRCLGVFGLSLYTTERELYNIFNKFGPVDKIQVVLDAQSGRSRGFAFVYYEAVDDARAAKEECSGMDIDGRKIRVDYSITQRAHTPTPGVYMGRPSGRRNNRYGYEKSDRYDRRSRSPRRRDGGGGGGGYYDRYERSRSRSRSPSRKYRRGYY